MVKRKAVFLGMVVVMVVFAVSCLAELVEVEYDEFGNPSTNWNWADGRGVDITEFNRFESYYEFVEALRAYWLETFPDFNEEHIKGLALEIAPRLIINAIGEVNPRSMRPEVLYNIYSGFSSFDFDYVLSSFSTDESYVVLDGSGNWDYLQIIFNNRHIRYRWPFLDARAGTVQASFRQFRTERIYLDYGLNEITFLVASRLMPRDSPIYYTSITISIIKEQK